MSWEVLRGLLIVALAVLGAVILLSLTVEESHPQKIPACLDQETQDRARTLMSRSYDQAFSHHTAMLYDIWVKDYSAEPPRAINGMRNNISAYARAKAAAEKWTYPVC